jgi:hypothetical protein
VGALALGSISAWDGLRLWWLRANGTLATVVVENVTVSSTSNITRRTQIHQEQGSENRLTLIIPTTPLPLDPATQSTEGQEGLDAFFAKLDATIDRFNAPLPDGRKILRTRVPEALVADLYSGKHIPALVADGVNDHALLGTEITMTPLEWFLQPGPAISLGLAVLGLALLVAAQRRKKA